VKLPPSVSLVEAIDLVANDGHAYIELVEGLGVEVADEELGAVVDVTLVLQPATLLNFFPSLQTFCQNKLACFPQLST
jgi:hypothetical protein